MKNIFISILILMILFFTVQVIPTGSKEKKDSFVHNFYPAYSKENNNTQKHPIIFLFGGSEGGMVFKGDKSVEMLRKKGYHVVTVAYFDYGDLKKVLNRIDIGGFGSVLEKYTKLPSVDADNVTLFGVSKGGELVLLLASLYPQVHRVIAVVPSSVVFQASNITLKQNSSWSYRGKELEFVPFNRFSLATIKGILSGGNYREMHLESLENEKAVKRARIKVENINGPIYLMSGRYDNMWPSMEMSNDIVHTLNAAHFKHTVEHKIYDCEHNVLGEEGAWENVLEFLAEKRK